MLVFQFHKGTIRTSLCNVLRVPSTSFQFHKGTIRTEFKGCLPNLSNSFQFHKGTIRTGYGEGNIDYELISIP